MRRFLVTNENKFTGQAVLVYNGKDILCIIDTSDTNMDLDTMNHFKRAVPVGPELLSISFSNTTTIIETAFEVTFDMFWKKYNKKINKARCIMLWGKMDVTMHMLAFYGIDAYDKYLKKESWRSKADAETYLRNKYWENEYK